MKRAFDPEGLLNPDKAAHAAPLRRIRPHARAWWAKFPRTGAAVSGAAIEEGAARASSSARRCVRGGGSKDFYGGALAGDVLDTRDHAGIVAYEPTGTVVTARAGHAAGRTRSGAGRTAPVPACEPPDHGGATVGRCRRWLSGPRRRRPAACVTSSSA